MKFVANVELIVGVTLRGAAAAAAALGNGLRALMVAMTTAKQGAA